MYGGMNEPHQQNLMHDQAQQQAPNQQSLTDMSGYNQQHQPLNENPGTQFQTTGQQDQEQMNNGFSISLMNQNNVANQSQNFAVQPADCQQSNIIREIEEFYAMDVEDPLSEQKAEAKKKAAEEFRQLMMTKFPNRYFILKRITQNTEFWQTCCWERNYVIIIDENYAKKLQNCYEVIVSYYYNFIITITALKSIPLCYFHCLLIVICSISSYNNFQTPHPKTIKQQPT